MAASELRTALNILGPRTQLWTPPVLTLSGATGNGLEELWTNVERFRTEHEAGDAFAKRRSEQGVRWMWSMLGDGLRHALLTHPGVAEAVDKGERDLRDGKRAPTAVAATILDLFTGR